jgi:hypothetical protein
MPLYTTIEIAAPPEVVRKTASLSLSEQGFTRLIRIPRYPDVGLPGAPRMALSHDREH